VRHSGAPPLPSHLPHRPPNEASAMIGFVTLDLLVDSGEAIAGLRPSFSSDVRWGERGAPVRFPSTKSLVEEPGGIHMCPNRLGHLVCKPSSATISLRSHNWDGSTFL
jgi:hypothetical protein